MALAYTVHLVNRLVMNGWGQTPEVSVTIMVPESVVEGPDHYAMDVAEELTGLAMIACELTVCDGRYWNEDHHFWDDLPSKHD